MASRTATKSGNWSDVTVWDGGTTLPGAGDTADSNGYTVTIDQNIDMSPGGALVNTNAGAGGFDVSVARVIVANIICTVRSVLNMTHSTGTMQITGNLQGGTSGTTIRTYWATAGHVSVTGNVTGGAGGAGNRGLHSAGAGNITVTGNVTGGAASEFNYGVEHAGTGNVTVTGTATGGSVANCFGVKFSSSGTCTIANATGGSATGADGARNTSTGTVSVTGVVTGGSAAGACGLYGSNSAGGATWKVAQHGANGNAAVGGFSKMVVDPTMNKIAVKRSDTGADYELSNDYPATTDVKSGVTYKLGTQLGTLAGGAVSISPYRGNL